MHSELDYRRVITEGESPLCPALCARHVGVCRLMLLTHSNRHFDRRHHNRAKRIKLPTHADTCRNKRVAFDDLLCLLNRFDFKCPQRSRLVIKGPSGAQSTILKEALSIQEMGRPIRFGLFFVRIVIHDCYDFHLFVPLLSRLSAVARCRIKAIRRASLSVRSQFCINACLNPCRPNGTSAFGTRCRRAQDQAPPTLPTRLWGRDQAVSSPP